jgi:hypothetical protein
MDAAALLKFPGFRNRRKKVTLPRKFEKFDIDPRYEITNIIRSHRVGKPDEQAVAVVKHRQIIVRLSDPGAKFRILKCGK